MQETRNGSELNNSGKGGTPAAFLGAPESGRKGRAFRMMRGFRKAARCKTHISNQYCLLFSSNGR